LNQFGSNNIKFWDQSTVLISCQVKYRVSIVKAKTKKVITKLTKVSELVAIM